MVFKKLSASALVAVVFVMPAGAIAQEFTNTEPSCAEYAVWITDLMKKGRRAGCDFANVKDWFDPQKHVRWCMKQTEARMLNAVEISRGHLAERCAKNGIDARDIR